MPTSAPDLTQLKSGMKATWMAGDFGQIANFTAEEAANFVNRIGIMPGAQVLDVACGTGNTAIRSPRRSIRDWRRYRHKLIGAGQKARRCRESQHSLRGRR